MIAVYAITEAPADGFETVVAGPLAAVVREVEEAPPAEPEAFLAHERIVEEVMAAQPVLPVRFGTTFADEGEVASLLREREAEWLARLEAVAGCVELAVRIEGSEREAARAELATYARDAAQNAFLVPAPDVEAFVARAAAWRSEDLDVSCTGPWPPYSFV
jgi:hypothetical protein